MNLPFLAAAASGLFAEHGLEVDVVGPVASGPEGVRRVADGAADFCVTGVYYFLAAAESQPAPLPARFVSMIVQRSPLAAIVRADSDVVEPADLAGRRVGEGKLTWLVDEYTSALRRLGIAANERVVVDPAAPHLALQRGEIDASASWVDAVPVVRERAGVAVRAVPVGPDVYTTGVVAADRVPRSVVARMQAAVAAALEAQRADPTTGLDELARRYPDIDPGGALEAWTLLEPYVFVPPGPGAIDEARWRRTLDHAAATHRLPVEIGAAV